MAAHWLELRVRISPRIWTRCPYCMLQSGGYATGRSHVQTIPTEIGIEPVRTQHTHSERPRLSFLE